MALTPEQREANEKLDEAVHALVAAYPDLLENSSNVVEYVLVLEGIKYNEEGRTTTDIGLAFRDGQCRLTSVVGMLVLAHDIMLSLDEED